MRFVLLMRNDHIAAGAMLAGGKAGADHLQGVIDSFGGSVDDIVPVVGGWDAVVICHFPSHAALLAFSLSASAAGQYVEAMPAIAYKELSDVTREAKRVTASQDSGQSSGPSDPAQ